MNFIQYLILIFILLNYYQNNQIIKTYSKKVYHQENKLIFNLHYKSFAQIYFQIFNKAQSFFQLFVNLTKYTKQYLLLQFYQLIIPKLTIFCVFLIQKILKKIEMNYENNKGQSQFTIKQSSSTQLPQPQQQLHFDQQCEEKNHHILKSSKNIKAKLITHIKGHNLIVKSTIKKQKSSYSSLNQPFDKVCFGLAEGIQRIRTGSLRIKQQYKEYVDSNQNEIKAKIVNGEFHGEVKAKFPDGSTLQCQFNYGNRIIGTLRVQGKVTYIGQFMQANFHGEGILQFNSGKVIKGRWDQNSPTGIMQVCYPSGQIYIGCLNNKLQKHGLGSYIFNDKSQFEGFFVEGQIKGVGLYRHANDKQVYGMWDKGQLIKEITAEQYIEQMAKRQQQSSGSQFSSLLDFQKK